MSGFENEWVKLTLHSYDITSENKLHYADATATDVIGLFYGAMMTNGFDSLGTLEEMYRFARDHMTPEQFEYVSGEDFQERYENENKENKV